MGNDARIPEQTQSAPSAGSALHLTDDQFTDLLLGAISPAVVAHLDTCAKCSDEAQRVSGAIGSFAQQSRLWAERRAASRPAPTPRRSPLAWLPITPIAWAAAVLALAAGIGIAHRERLATAPPSLAEVHSAPAPALAASTAPTVAIASAPTGIAPAAAASPVAPATLKSDNELLSAIDGELTDTDLSGASTYGLTTNRRSVREHSSKGISN
jgi:hypothetical protein